MGGNMTNGGKLAQLQLLQHFTVEPLQPQKVLKYHTRFKGQIYEMLGA